MHLPPWISWSLHHLCVTAGYVAFTRWTRVKRKPALWDDGQCAATVLRVEVLHVQSHYYISLFPTSSGTMKTLFAREAIPIPEGVEVSIKGRVITVKGMNPA